MDIWNYQADEFTWFLCLFWDFLSSHFHFITLVFHVTFLISHISLSLSPSLPPSLSLSLCVSLPPLPRAWNASQSFQISLIQKFLYLLYLFCFARERLEPKLPELDIKFYVRSCFCLNNLCIIILVFEESFLYQGR